MSEQEKRFIKGFNHGYLLAEHEPQLLKQLLTGIHDGGQYLDGLKEGQKQLEKEKIAEKFKQAGSDQSKSKDEKGFD